MIITERLELIPGTVESIGGALGRPEVLARRLNAVVPPTWPPELLDDDAIEFTLQRLREDGEQAGWWLHFVVLREGSSQRRLVGIAGYKGSPTPDGTVEIGYGIVEDQRRRGYATEAVLGLLGYAFGAPQVRRVIAETLPHLEPSIGVLRKCGFRLIDGGSEPGVIRYELTRDEFSGRTGEVS